MKLPAEHGRTSPAPLLKQETKTSPREDSKPKKMHKKKAGVQKRLEDLDTLLWGDVLGDLKPQSRPELQKLGKEAGLTPMRMGAKQGQL